MPVINLLFLFLFLKKNCFLNDYQFPFSYTGRTLRQVHKFKGITPEDFDIWVECCTEAYGIMGVDKETTEEGMEILKDLKEGVVI